MGFTPGENGVFSGGGNTVNYSVAVPEPATIGKLAVGCLAAGLGFVRRRR
ncbi:MAG: PEP-CTERM sorting domain-containing protein [Pirellulales bacterium]|nr:PEP-CTERM sorting domain-containing protein [Pirellulales bacterium]MBL7193148.1 PEP-CTERM sorting domain-containing protein [Pirellulales bacterium]